MSVSFGPVEVTGPTTLTKTIKVVNTGLASRTYDVSYDAINEMPGVVLLGVAGHGHAVRRAPRRRSRSR